MNEYWMVSIPEKNGDKEPWTNIENAIRPLGNTYKLVPPQFKFGNIDDLIKFSEDSGKIIRNLEAVITGIVHNINNLLDERQELIYNLQVNCIWVIDYLHTFHWDYLKYPTRKKPQTIISDIQEQGTLIFEKMKMKISEYNSLKNKVEKIEAKHTGSLLARDLSDFVKKEDIIIGSTFLETVLVLVPSIDIENWKNYYEHFWNGIVPGSTKLLYRDNDFGLFTVVVTKKSVEAFKSWSMKSRIIVRKFDYNEEEINLAKITEYKSKMQLTVNRRNLQFWLKKHYSLCFSMYFHIQILRTMSESILKYGLLTPYSIMLIRPKIKNALKIRQVLEHYFSLFEECNCPNSDKWEQDFTFTFTYPNCGNKDYYPYVNCLVHVTGCPVKSKVQLLASLESST